MTPSDHAPDFVGADAASRLSASVLTTADRPEISVEEPYSGEEIGTIPACTSADVDAAVERSREARDEWADRDVDERAEILLGFHDLVLDRRGTLLFVACAQ